VHTTGYVVLHPGDTQTLLSGSQWDLIGVCTAGPTTELDIQAQTGFGIYNTHSTSLGDVNGSDNAGTPVAIAHSNGLIDGGRFNLVGFFGAALDGTFLSYSGGNNTCNYEMTAIADTGPSGNLRARPIAAAR
jgi:hypothetical protein